MVEPQDSFFWQMALRSGLVDATRLQECWDKIDPDRRTADAIDRRLARQIVDAGYLTDWQAQQVARGRGASIQINKYTILGAIGEGGMGRVFLARDTRLNRPVALKVLSRNRLNDPRAIVRFRREARLGAQLQHENLVRVYDEGEVNGHCYLVMEYIEGSSVGHLLAGHGPMPTSTACKLARQVASALNHAGEKGMIHRDVNPHNILVTRNGTAKLTDLGVAIELGDDNSLTLDGGMIGNYDYISPEQARRSHDVDSRSDIYSLGCTLYHMVAGRVPFPSSSLPEKIHNQLTAYPSPLSSIVPGVPRAFEDVVSRMMRKSPEERYQDPLAVARALEPFIEGVFPAGGSDATLIMDLRTTGGGGSRDSSPIFPPVLSTSDGMHETESPANFAFSLSSSSSEIIQTSPNIRPLQPGDITTKAGSRKNDSRSVTPHSRTDSHPSPPVPGQAIPNLDHAGSWLARVRTLSPTKRVALASLLAAMILISSVVMVISRRRNPVNVLNPGAGAGLWPGTTRGGTGESLKVAIIRSDGTEMLARDLKDALRSGVQGDLRIILRGRGAIRLEAEGLEVPSGTVTIEADPTARPVLVIGMPGVEPFLRVKTRSNLKLEGLVLVADYEGQGGKPPPLIEVKGNLELRRCAFSTTDQVVASGAVSTEGRRLTAVGCWFGGFKQCLDVAAFAGTEVELEQCMIIRSPGSDPWDSWAIRVHYEPSLAASNTRKLTLRRCTIRGACLLRADDFHQSAPLGVTIIGTAVEAGVLLAWKSDPESVQGSLIWVGQDNLYDLSRASRAIRLDGPSIASSGSTDSDVWAKLMEERGSLDRPIVFSIPSSTNPGSSKPEDFPAQVQDGKTIGAEPGQVGPESSPTAPSVGLVPDFRTDDAEPNRPSSLSWQG